MSSLSADAQALEIARPKIQERISEAATSIWQVEQMIEDAEQAVEPFVKILKTRNDEEMIKMADTADESILAAKDSFEHAREMVQLDVSDLQSLDGLEEQPKSVLTKILVEELRKPLLQLGRLERRLNRTKNLTRGYRREVNRSKYLEMLTELTPGMLDKVKSAASNPQTMTEVEDSIKEAESNVEPFNKCLKMTADEMTGMADNASGAIEAAKTSMAEARKLLAPVDSSLDEDLQYLLARKVKEEAAEALKKPELRLARLQSRLNRTVTLLKHFRNDMQGRLEEKIQTVRTKALRLIRHDRVVNSLSPEQLFCKVDTDGSESIDESEFFTYLEAAERPEGEKIPFPFEDMKALFDHLSQEGSSIPKDVFFEKLAETYVSVVKATPMTEGKSLITKVLQQLQVGNVLEVLEGPVFERTALPAVHRVRVQLVEGEAQGWVTVKSNAGTYFLKEIPAPITRKAAPLLQI